MKENIMTTDTKIQLNVNDYRAAFGWTEELVEYRWMTAEFVNKATGEVIEKIDADLEFAARKKLNKIESAKKTETKKAAKKAAVNDMMEDLKREFGDKASIKKTMPHVEAGGIKFYMVIGETTNSGIRLNFRVPDMKVDQVSRYVPSLKIEAQDNACSDNSCWINRLNSDTVIHAINLVANAVGTKL